MGNNIIEPAQNIKKTNNKVVVGIVIVIILAISVYFFLSNNNSNNGQLKSYTLSDVASSNSKSSCWTVIDNNVYDVTNFISKHKGGDKILAVCGIDGTDLFTGKSPLGRAHSDLAKTLLSSMKIGDLQK